MEKFLLCFTLIFAIITSTVLAIDEYENQAKTNPVLMKSLGDDFSLLIQSIQRLEDENSALKKDVSIFKAAKSTYDSVIDTCEFNKSTCYTTLETYGTDLARYELFKDSFLSGIFYSGLPEIVRDVLVSRGYPQTTARLAAILVQGGLIAYSARSYAPVVTGILVRGSCDFLGVPSDISATAASTAAMLVGASVSPEHMINYPIALVGSYGGSSLSLKAKSWIADIVKAYRIRRGYE